MTVPSSVPHPVPAPAPLSDPLPRLIATDLDRTLLTSQGEVSARTRNALDAASAAGIHVVPATARNPVGLRHLQPILGFDQWALCSNGAFGIHLTSGELLFSTELDPSVLRHVTSTLTDRIAGIRFAAIRDAGEQFSAESGYSAFTSFTDHMRDPASMSSLPLAEVTESPALKLVFRHPEMSAPELYALASDLVRHGVINNAGFEMTLSGAPFVELMAAGVSKASGLAALCHHLAIDRREVIAFGDGLNDRDMLAWAGTGVAVANADPDVIAAADIVTASHDEDGVALVIEDLLTRSAHGDTRR